MFPDKLTPLAAIFPELVIVKGNDADEEDQRKSNGTENDQNFFDQMHPPGLRRLFFFFLQMPHPPAQHRLSDGKNTGEESFCRQRRPSLLVVQAAD